ncbi:unnamed protein product, partial [Linum tenue]
HRQINPLSASVVRSSPQLQTEKTNEASLLSPTRRHSMAAAVSAVVASSFSATPTAVLGSRKQLRTATQSGKPPRKVWAVGDFSHFGEVVSKDFEFLKKGIGKGIDWANEVFRIPQVTRAVDDVVWMRNLEDPAAANLEKQTWPQPYYPGLTGVDLLMADLQAMVTYASYFYYLSKIWSKPLPEVYDPEAVADYFNCRPHVVAFRLLEALSGLHDQIPPFPRTMAMKIIEQELGAPIQSSFTYLSEEPVAAASFGQVYRGKTIDGRDVAVKVQRPNLRHVVVRDIYILRIGLGLLQKITNRISHLPLYADEFGKGLVGELDYSIEAENASKYLEAHSSFTFIHIPKVYRDLSRKRVLTMEWVVGESPTDLLSVATSNANHEVSETERIEANRKLLDLELEGALGEVEFRDGIPDVKFSRDGASLIRGMVSKEATPLRQQLCKVIADVMHQWVKDLVASTSRSSVSVDEYQAILRDPRLKVIFLRIISSTRKDPALMLKFSWTSFIMAVTASARAFHRVLVSLSEAFVSSLPLSPKRVAVSA